MSLKSLRFPSPHRPVGVAQPQQVRLTRQGGPGRRDGADFEEDAQFPREVRRRYRHLGGVVLNPPGGACVGVLRAFGAVAVVAVYAVPLAGYLVVELPLRRLAVVIHAPVIRPDSQEIHGSARVVAGDGELVGHLVRVHGEGVEGYVALVDDGGGVGVGAAELVGGYANRLKVGSPRRRAE